MRKKLRWTEREISDAMHLILEEECYDMAEHIHVNTTAWNMFGVLSKDEKELLSVILGILKGGHDFELFGGQVHVQGNKAISFSEDGCTGVSRTAYKVVDDSEDGYTLNEQVKTLLDMINEAWYLANDKD